MLPLGFVTLVFSTVAIVANPVVQVTQPGVTLEFTRRVQTSSKTIPEIDRARAAQLLATGKSLAAGEHSKRQDSSNITNVAVAYLAQVGVGSPPTPYSLLIDTGSSNTWVGAGQAYRRTSTSHATGNLVEVTYGSGLFTGSEFTDAVTLTDALTISAQSIGAAILAEGFQGFDGILGIGPTDLTEGTVVPSLAEVPTVTDNLFSQNKISQKVVGVFFAPPSSDSDTNGEMTFGSVDTSKTTSDVTFAPISSSSPANEFFGIDQTITYGNASTTVLPLSSGIVDTGTTLLMLETNAFNTYTSLTGATPDATTGLLSISPDDYANLQSLFFNIAGTTFEFTKNAQTWPRALNADIGGASDDILLIVADLGVVGQGLDFINGMTFLERFYSVFDSTNDRVGFATTAHTLDETN